jgi:hypothetical protein
MSRTEYIHVSADDALMYREHEAEQLTRTGWYYRELDKDEWRGPHPSREKAMLAAETRAANSFYALEAARVKVFDLAQSLVELESIRSVQWMLDSRAETRKLGKAIAEYNALAERKI